MVSDAEMMEEIDAGLAHAGRLLLAAADKAHVRVQAAEETSEIAEATKALEGAVRSLRLTYALRMKLRRDARRGDREDAEAQAKRDKERVSVRKHQLEAAVRALVPSEGDYEDEDNDSFDLDLFHILGDEAVCETFLTEELGDQTARILRKLGFEITPEGRVVRAPAAHPPAHPREGGGRRDPGLPAFDSSG